MRRREIAPAYGFSGIHINAPSPSLLTLCGMAVYKYIAFQGGE